MATIAELTAKIERIEARIERWETKPQTEKRIAKIERQYGRIEMAQAKINAKERDAALVEQFADEAATADLPVDTFDITYSADAVTGIGTFAVAVFDSPFDDGFVGGEPLKLRVNAEDKPNGNGGVSSLGSTSSLANGQYWQGLSNQTLTLGSNTYDDLADYAGVTAYVMKANTNEILAIQAFDLVA